MVFQMLLRGDCYENITITGVRTIHCSKSGTKMFTLKGLQTIHRSMRSTIDSSYAFKCKHFRNTHHTVTFGIPL
jgi:hypothetical protein